MGRSFNSKVKTFYIFHATENRNKKYFFMLRNEAKYSTMPRKIGFPGSGFWTLLSNFEKNE